MSRWRRCTGRRLERSLWRICCPGTSSWGWASKSGRTSRWSGSSPSLPSSHLLHSAALWCCGEPAINGNRRILQSYYSSNVTALWHPCRFIKIIDQTLSRLIMLAPYVFRVSSVFSHATKIHSSPCPTLESLKPSCIIKACYLICSYS